jgi:hypothetical protein
MEKITYLDNILLDTNISNNEKAILLKQTLDNAQIQSSYSILELSILLYKINNDNHIDIDDQLSNIIPSEIKTTLDLSPLTLLILINSGMICNYFLNISI